MRLHLSVVETTDGKLAVKALTTEKPTTTKENRSILLLYSAEVVAAGKSSCSIMVVQLFYSKGWVVMMSTPFLFDVCHVIVLWVSGRRRMTLLGDAFKVVSCGPSKRKSGNGVDWLTDVLFDTRVD